KSQSVEEVRVHPAVIRIGEVNVKERIKLEPGYGDVVTAGFQSITNSVSPNRPARDRIDGGELRKIDRLQLRRWFETIELQDGGGIDSILMDVGKVRVGLNHVKHAIEP